MRVKVEPAQLEELDEELASLRRVLSGEYGDTGDLINAAQRVLEECDLLLEMISDETGWKRPHYEEEEDPEADLPAGYDPDEDRSPDSNDPPDRDDHGSY